MAVTYVTYVHHVIMYCCCLCLQIAMSRLQVYCYVAIFALVLAVFTSPSHAIIRKYESFMMSLNYVNTSGILFN